MMSDTSPLLTAWSARKAHIDSGEMTTAFGTLAPMTLCRKAGTRAGERTTLGLLEQEAIDSMPLCGQCARRQPKESR
ncbi:hypothetical protein GS474_15975 [Rhodococcus hoagii]|nr:hypothetical protein [Prescottella equi]